ncbi:hypothetical protein PLESTB_001587200 [Pleodorina starrii]|uniref:Uncharacterized protein n=1 Tax=Pleodorina starrii TaxID=330485 RepID=A0A9W6F8H5_9CHLO|nr:hypothetical protein PLESTM_000583500 [Pleodorina starrii]GLC60223.1 hypothetical protein PLESTB_001587200 [Pleodorina starrii]GLC65983.1 hypothetical protein PLESTF_000369200 [Pleodorina starrii]
MGFSDGQDSSAQTQGHWAPTGKARRAEADGRARRVHSALSKPSAPAWVAAKFPPSDFESAAQATASDLYLSPAALAHRQRAAKLSLGFRCQILEQLAEERARLADRLHSLAAACDGAVLAHSSSPGGSGTASPKAAPPAEGRSEGSGAGASGHEQQQQHQLSNGAATRSAAVAAAAAAAAAQRLRTPPPQTAGDAAADLQRTTRQPPTPATVWRPAPTVTVPSAVMGASAVTGGAPPASPLSIRASSPLSRMSSAAAASGPSTPTRAAPAGAAVGLAGRPVGRCVAPQPLSGPAGARRRLTFGEFAQASEPGLRAASTTSPPPKAYSAVTVTSMSPLWSPAVQSGAAASTPAPALAPAAREASGLFSAALTELARAAAAGQRLAAAAALGVMEGAVDVAAAEAAPAAAGWGQPARRLAWQDPVGLLPQGCLQKFAGARDGLWPYTHEPYSVRQSELSYEASHLGHRERFRVGVAELDAELMSSWRALVASGAV